MPASHQTQQRELGRGAARTPNAASRASSTPPSTPSARTRRRACPRSPAARGWCARPSTCTSPPAKRCWMRSPSARSPRSAAVIDAAEPERGDPADALARVVAATWRTLGRYHALVAINTGTQTHERAPPPARLRARHAAAAHRTRAGRRRLPRRRPRRVAPGDAHGAHPRRQRGTPRRAGARSRRRGGAGRHRPRRGHEFRRERDRHRVADEARQHVDPDSWTPCVIAPRA